jgi:hypothetical protein
MKNLSLLVALMLVPVITQAQPAAPAQPRSCDPVGQIRFVCGQDGPEDLVQVPDSRWLIASAYGQGGGLFLIDTTARTSTKLFPSATATDRLDKKTYDSCPGPITGADRERFRTHGLFLKPGQRSIHTLYVVYHGVRESIEVFELDVRKQPMVTWIGCAVAPDPVGLNSVVALPEGGFVATNFDPRPAPGSRGGPFTPALLEGRNNGELWEWHTGKGWNKVPGSESAGANGVELSADGKWFYVAQWGNRAFYRLSRGAAKVDRQEIPLGFRVDNVRWAPDGTLLVAGQGEMTSVIGKVDPKTMTYREIISYPTSDAISAATVAVQVGNEFWAGSFRGDRVAIYPAAGVKPAK